MSSLTGPGFRFLIWKCGALSCRATFESHSLQQMIGEHRLLLVPLESTLLLHFFPGLENRLYQLPRSRNCCELNTGSEDSVLNIRLVIFPGVRLCLAISAARPSSFARHPVVSDDRHPSIVMMPDSPLPLRDTTSMVLRQVESVDEDTAYSRLVTATQITSSFLGWE